MINCNTALKSILWDKCDVKDSIGSIKKVWLTKFENVISYATDASDLVTGITLSAGTYWQEFSFAKGICSFEDIPTASPEGPVFFNAALTLKFSKLDNDKKNAFLYIVYNDVIAIIQDENDQYHIAGLGRGLYFGEGGRSTGAAISDVAATNIKLIGLEKESAKFVSSYSIFSANINRAEA